MATSYQSNNFPMAVLQRALSSSIGDGTFTDVAYYLYTKRQKGSMVGQPRIVYANCRVMRAAALHLDKRMWTIRPFHPRKPHFDQRFVRRCQVQRSRQRHKNTGTSLTVTWRIQMILKIKQ